MATNYSFEDVGGTVRLYGPIVPDPATSLPSAAYVTVVAAPPTTYVSPLMFDSTASTGGLYAWTGSAYQKVGLATT